MSTVTLEFTSGVPTIAPVETTVTLDSFDGALSAAATTAQITAHNASATAHTAVAHTWTQGQTFNLGATVGVAGTPADVLIASTHATVPWYIHSYSSIFSGVRDDILNISYNIWGTPDITRGSIGMQMECNYYDGVDTNNEIIFASTAPNGTFPLRMLQLNETYTGLGTIFTRGQVLMYSSNPAAAGPFVTLTETGQFKLQQGAYILGSNNVQFIKSLNVASVETTLFYLDTTNTVQIAPGGNATAFGAGVVLKDGTLHCGRTGGNNNIEFDDGATAGVYKWAIYLGGTTMYLWNGAFYFTLDGTNIGIGNYNPAVAVDISGDSIRLRTLKTPANAAAAGIAGQICRDDNYLYVCIASGQWKRAALTTW